MPPKKPSGGLPPEVLAVLRISPDLPALSSTGQTRQFAEHINDGKREQCLKLLRQWDKEFRMMRFLRENRN